MKQKLKGCRPSKDVMQDYSNVSAQLGDTVFQIDRSHSLKQQLLKRQRELMLEMNSAQEQEKAAADAQAKEDADAPQAVANG